MFKSISFLLALLVWVSASAADYINYLAHEGRWKNYVPDNYELVAKLGDRAFYWSADSDAEKIRDNEVLTKDPFIIFKPNYSVMAERKTNSGTVIYKARYTFDSKSRRFTPIRFPENKKNIIALGCSFTLGTGVNNDETFPYYLSELRSNYNIYNMGIYGAGANDILDDLKSFKRFEDISRVGGIVIYSAIFDHIERSLCTLKCYRPTYRDWVLKKSNYEYDEKNKLLVNKGSFASSRPIKGLLFSAIVGIGLFDKLNFPPELTDEQIDDYVVFLAEIKKLSREKLNSDFYFTFYPDHYEHWSRIKTSLEKHNIKYLDLSNIDLKKATERRQTIILDGHPTKLSNFIFANLVHHQLPK